MPATIEPRKQDAITAQLGILSFERQLPYLIAIAYSLVISTMISLLMPSPPLPRFMDVYLIGIALICACWSFRPALLVYGWSLLFASWILPPKGSFVVTEGHDLYRITSYSVTAAVILFVIEQVKARADRP